MDKTTLVLYRQIADRYCKMAWTHKIQEKQADLHLKRNRWIRNANAGLQQLAHAVLLLYSLL